MSARCTWLLGEWPEVLADAAKGREPHEIVGYLGNLAQVFQSYYTRLERVSARLSWERAIRDVYAAGLDILGISAPERMERFAVEAEEEA
ncbi:MAG: hypothetical protein HYV09_33400 [Deltaproteobacteria bacterium]|nr:hypothetical protein [Deltaproteobacteria bacterium]